MKKCGATSVASADLATSCAEVTSMYGAGGDIADHLMPKRFLSVSSATDSESYPAIPVRTLERLATRRRRSR